MKKTLISLAQIVVGVAILAAIFLKFQRSGDLGKLVEAIRTAAGNWPILVFGTLGLGFSFLFCTVRWMYLLEAQGVKLPFRRLLTLYLIGQFFSAFMLGATGGDVVKAYYVATEARHKRAEVVTTVFVDRVVGMLALIGLVVVVMLVRLPFFLAHPRMRVVIVFNALLLTGMISILFVVFRRNVFERWAFFRRLEQRTALGEIIGRVYNSMRFCLRHPGLLPKTIFLSFLNHTTMVTWSLYIAIALDIPHGFIALLTVVPLINAVAAIPLTPGGLGTRETMAIYMFGALGVPAARAVTFSLLCYGAILVWSAIGGVFYMVYAIRGGKPHNAEHGTRSAESDSLNS